MNKVVSQWLEIIFVLILIYLVLSNAKGFSMALQAIGSVQNSAIKVLQGR
jgi:uncharacterized protein YpmB